MRGSPCRPNPSGSSTRTPSTRPPARALPARPGSSIGTPRRPGGQSDPCAERNGSRWISGASGRSPWCAGYLGSTRRRRPAWPWTWRPTGLPGGASSRCRTTRARSTGPPDGRWGASGAAASNSGCLQPRLATCGSPRPAPPHAGPGPSRSCSSTSPTARPPLIPRPGRAASRSPPPCGPRASGASTPTTGGGAPPRWPIPGSACCPRTCISTRMAGTGHERGWFRRSRGNPAPAHSSSPSMRTAQRAWLPPSAGPVPGSRSAPSCSSAPTRPSRTPGVPLPASIWQ